MDPVVRRGDKNKESMRKKKNLLVWLLVYLISLIHWKSSNISNSLVSTLILVPEK